MAARRNAVNTLCRDCGVFTGSAGIAQRCTACGSPRQVRHRDLGALSVAHIDCDAFYAMVEKRDNPGSPTGPAIIGGGRREVVLACCYVARLHGVRSAMPMFKALAACPDAVVIPSNMEKYRSR
jgi:DNA polymerase IV